LKNIKQYILLFMVKTLLFLHDSLLLSTVFSSSFSLRVFFVLIHDMKIFLLVWKTKFARVNTHNKLTSFFIGSVVLKKSIFSFFFIAVSLTEKKKKWKCLLVHYKRKKIHVAQYPYICVYVFLCIWNLLLLVPIVSVDDFEFFFKINFILCILFEENFNLFIRYFHWKKNRCI